MTVEVQLLGRLEVILTDMGSGTSRGKRVAPARVREAHAISRINARNRSQQEQQQSCRSEGRDPDRSSSSRDDDAIDGDADTAAADEQEQSWACVKKSPTSQKKKKKKSRSYGLCRSRQEDEDSSVEEPRGTRDVNKRAFLHVRKQTATPSGHVTSSSQAFLTQEVPLEAPTPERKPALSKWQSSSLTPVILYDGSEEELMDTIEREFS